MISETHFRPGNRILYKGQQTTLRAGDFAVIKWGNVEGIPLTPEVLERAGFVKKSEYVPGVGSSIRFNHENGFMLWAGFVEPIQYYSSYIGLKLPILHLHQLQNLFFALTGEELQIKP